MSGFIIFRRPPPPPLPTLVQTIKILETRSEEFTALHLGLADDLYLLAAIKFLKEFQGLSTLHVQLQHELTEMVRRERKFTAADAIGVAEGSPVGKIVIAELPG